MARRSAGGVLVLGLFGVLMSMCDADSSSTSGTAITPSPIFPASGYDPRHLVSSYAPVSDAAASAELHYLHAPMNVRSQPRKDASLVRTMDRGEAVRLGPKDASGWAPVYGSYGGTPTGYLFRASDNVRTKAPAAGATPRRLMSSGSSRRSSAEARGYYTGPRGGCYTYSASGRKRYVDHSYCR